MKSLPAGLAAHYTGGTTTVAHALRIEREDGEIYGFTSHDRDVEISGVLYKADPGLRVTDIAISAGTAVGTMELTTLHDGEIFTVIDMRGGRWLNARFVIFRYNTDNLADGIDTLLTGYLGELQPLENSLIAELRDLRQRWQQPVGSVSQRTCRYRLGDAKCKVDISGPPFRVTGSITHLTSLRVFRDSLRTEAEDFFGEGEIEWTSGNNIGLRNKIRSYAANGTFTLALPLLSAVQIGDDYEAVAGCRRRPGADCILKFDNIHNFGAEPHRRGVNNIIKPAA